MRYDKENKRIRTPRVNRGISDLKRGKGFGENEKGYLVGSSLDSRFVDQQGTNPSY